MEYVMLTEVRSSEAKQIRRETKGRDYSPRRGKILVPRKDRIVQALQCGLTKDHYVLAFPKSTATPPKFININSLTIKNMETSNSSEPMTSPTLTCSWEDFLAKLLALLENAVDLKTPAELYSLKSLGFSSANIQDSCYLKTSKGCYLMTEDELSKPSSPRLQNWGMLSNGKCLTQRISESPRIGKECSLSDILEDSVDAKYFLSESFVKKLMLYNQRQIENRRGFRAKPRDRVGISPALKVGGGLKDDLVYDS